MFYPDNTRVPKNANLYPSIIGQHFSYDYMKFLLAFTLNLLLFSGVINTSTIHRAFATEQSTHQECIAPASGGVAWWPLDENSGEVATDIVGQPNDGLYINSPVPGVGLVDRALSFNGINQSLQVPDHPEINFGADSFTIAGWIKNSSNQGILVDKWISGSGYRLRLSSASVGESRLTLTLSGPGGQDNYVSEDGIMAINLADDQWHYIAVVVDRTATNESRFYIDGETVNTFTPGNFIGTLDNDLPLYIAHDGDDDTFFAGLIDELMLFNRALDQGELNAIYAADSAGQCKPASQSQIHGLVWNDLDIDGLQDADEPGEPGIEVILLDQTDDIISFTTTNATGNYSFSVDTSQIYKLQVEAPPDRTFTVQDVGTDDTIDSDFDPSTGQTEPVAVSVGDIINLDAGLVTTFDSITGLVWQDENGNGLQDDDEVGLPDRTLLRQDGSGAVISTTTDATGAYTFTNQPPGVYTITQVFLPGMAQTAPTVPAQKILLESEQHINVPSFGNQQQDEESCIPNSDSIARDSLELFIDNNTDNDATYNLTVSGYPGFTPRGILTATAPLGPEQPAEPFLFVPNNQAVYFSLALSAEPEIEGTNAQYQIIATNQETGHSFGCSARFWQNDDLTITPISPPLVDILPGTPQEITYEFTNETDEIIVIQIAVTNSFTIDGQAFNAIQFDNLQPGESLFEEITIQPGESVQFTFLAELLPYCLDGKITSGMRTTTDTEIAGATNGCVPEDITKGQGEIKLLIKVGNNISAIDMMLVIASKNIINGKGLKCSGGERRTQASMILDKTQVPVALTGSISGTIWDDRAEDGISPGDPPIFGIEVHCMCADGFKQPDSVDFVTATTDSGGAYQFYDLELNGKYVIKVIPPSRKALTKHNIGSESQDSDIHYASAKSALLSPTTSNASLVVDGGLIASDALWGDVNCKDGVNTSDALFILQADIGSRTIISRCPLSSEASIYGKVCDVSLDGNCDLVDGLFILRCDIGLSNIFCPSNFVEITARKNQLDISKVEQSETTLSIPPLRVTPNSIFTIPVIVTTDEDINAITLDVVYDSSEFRIIECQMDKDKSFGYSDCNTAIDNTLSFGLLTGGEVSGKLHLADITIEHIGSPQITGKFEMNARVFAGPDGIRIPFVQTNGIVTIDPVAHSLHLPIVMQ